MWPYALESCNHHLPWSNSSISSHLFPLKCLHLWKLSKKYIQQSLLCRESTKIGLDCWIPNITLWFPFMICSFWIYDNGQRIAWNANSKSVNYLHEWGKTDLQVWITPNWFKNPSQLIYKSFPSDSKTTPKWFTNHSQVIHKSLSLNFARQTWQTVQFQVNSSANEIQMTCRHFRHMTWCSQLIEFSISPFQSNSSISNNRGELGGILGFDPFLPYAYSGAHRITHNSPFFMVATARSHPLITDPVRKSILIL